MKNVSLKPSDVSDMAGKVMIFMVGAWGVPNSQVI